MKKYPEVSYVRSGYTSIRVATSPKPAARVDVFFRARALHKSCQKASAAVDKEIRRVRSVFDGTAQKEREAVIAQAKADERAKQQIAIVERKLWQTAQAMGRLK